MANKEIRLSGLGRGLSALLDDENAPVDGGGIEVARPRAAAIDRLHPNPTQPRRHFNPESVQELAESIKQKGVLQPILVRPSPAQPEEFEIIAGERRWRAAQLAQLHEVPIIVGNYDDGESLELSLIENIQREDLTPIEEAMAFQRLIQEFEHNQAAVGDIVGKSRSHVTNALRLLTLPARIQEMVSDGRLTMGHARALITSENANALADAIIARGLNVRQTEALVKTGLGARAGQAQRLVRRKDPDTLALERNLTENLGLRVEIADRQDHGGKVVIAYQSLEQLDEICRRLCQGPPPTIGP